MNKWYTQYSGTLNSCGSFGWAYHKSMLKFLEKSLLLRLGLAMGLITTLAFVGMLSSVFIAETLEGQASAVNQAGTLRMQSYRIALDSSNYPEGAIDAKRLAQTRALVEEFQQRLYSPRLTGALTKTDSLAIHNSYKQVTVRWRDEMRPQLEEIMRRIAAEAYLSVDTEALRIQYLGQVDYFVSHVDDMVNILEHEVENRIRLLRLIQVSSLFLTTLVVSITMYYMHTGVLTPLRELLNAASGVRRGDFSPRVDIQHDDELGQLGQAFNSMAEELSVMYSDLEKRVRIKTQDLERSNRSLELLYNVTRRLSEAPFGDDVYQLLLRDIEQMVDTGPGSICLGDCNSEHAYKLSTTRIAIPSDADICQPPDCSKCFSSGQAHLLSMPRCGKSTLRVHSTPIRDQRQQYGVLMVELPRDAEALQDWQLRLLEGVASHIAIALNINRRSSQARMLALLEERGVIARELHDSLAQSLSYLKIQVARLDAASVSIDGNAAIRQVTAELRDGLNSAYRQLRELLTTFRLKMDGADLSETLKQTVAEFSQRGDLPISLNNQIGSCKLGPNAELHMIQIVREALSNVQRHAQANQASVTIECSVDGDVTLHIDDDGIGMSDSQGGEHHYGRIIMEERAHGLAGSIEYGRSAMGGTRVTLAFRVGDNADHLSLATEEVQRDAGI